MLSRLGERELVCPQSKMKLRVTSLGDAETAISPRRFLCRAEGVPRPFGRTAKLLLREDGSAAFPIVDGVPILLVPEVLLADESASRCNLCDPKYHEAYLEMAHYNAVAEKEAACIERSESMAALRPAIGLGDADRRSFPDPCRIWIDGIFDGPAQYDAFKHLSPIEGKRVLQVGGKGIHAIQFLLAGAAEAWLIAPMLGEIQCALALARRFEVENRFFCAVGIGEELPFAPKTFDAVFTKGCAHHMVPELAFPEFHRVLMPGGRFAAVEPWRAPWYGLGTRLLGKREEPLLGKRGTTVFCRPLTRESVRPLLQTFPQSRIIHHGALTRYPLLALYKMKLPISGSAVRLLNSIDDAISSCIPGLRQTGSGVALLAERDE
ncbi:MAG: methyltransferase domain-containing protein [Pirellulales bacterium]